MNRVDTPLIIAYIIVVGLIFVIVNTIASRCPLAHERCRVENPVLKPTQTGTMAACHAVGEA